MPTAAKRKGLTIEIYNGARGDFRFRLVARNGRKFGHSYNEKRFADKSIERLTDLIRTGDYSIVDKTRPRRVRVPKRSDGR
jgi:uncharacterized protein YegP (UPF0339 family)